MALKIKKKTAPVSTGPHYYIAHARKTLDHDYTPKRKGDPSYCTVCGFDEELHTIGLSLPDGAAFDEKSKTWGVPAAA